MKKIADSLKSYFKCQKLTQTEVANKIGCSQVYVSAILNNRQEFKTKTAVLKWVEMFGFNEIFLLTGEGSLFNDDSNDKEIMDRVNDELNKDDDPIPSDIKLIKAEVTIETQKQEIDRLHTELQEAYRTIAKLEIKLEEYEIQDNRKEKVI